VVAVIVKSIIRVYNIFMSKALNLMKSGGSASVPNTETPAVSTGKGGIPNSLKIKAAGTKDAPGVDKTVNKF